ncbi:unnamed protein product [Urochloa decumbens]|uniref:Uncharacterized protein n=1 Tax=Urochloa decumbens TaxID=240449 RepID=A0ABC8YUT4_9POAL
MEGYGAVQWSEAHGAAAGSPVLSCPAPQLPVPPPFGRTAERFYCGGTVGSRPEDEHVSSELHEMFDPITSAIYGPLFSGPPPERPQNPMIHGPLFGKDLPTSSFAVATRSPGFLWTTCNPGSFCGTPLVVLTESFSCLGEHRRRRRVAASA